MPAAAVRLSPVCSSVYSTATLAAHKRIIHLVRQSRNAPANRAPHHTCPLAKIAPFGQFLSLGKLAQKSLRRNSQRIVTWQRV
jgi:hypothetical protein